MVSWKILSKHWNVSGVSACECMFVIFTLWLKTFTTKLKFKWEKYFFTYSSHNCIVECTCLWGFLAFPLSKKKNKKNNIHIWLSIAENIPKTFLYFSHYPIAMILHRDEFIKKMRVFSQQGSAITICFSSMVMLFFDPLNQKIPIKIRHCLWWSNLCDMKMRKCFC